MNQPKLLERAKQGDEEAIASVMNDLLKNKGINVQAAQKDDCLLVVLKSAQALEQKSSVATIHKLMMTLNVASIKSVKVYGKQIGQPSPAWMETLNLKSQIEKPKAPTRSSDKSRQGKLNAIADLWPAWFPYPSSWLRAIGLAVPTYAGVAILSLEFWRSLCWIVLLATTKSPELLDAFILLTVALLFASLIIYLVFVVLFSWLLRLFWSKAPEKMGLNLYGFVVTTVASLFLFLPFLNSVYFPENLVAVIIQKSVTDEWQVIAKLLSFWLFPAAYLYQAEYLTRQRIIPKLSNALRNNRFLRQAFGWKPQKFAKKLLIILLVPLIAVGVYLFSKFPELKETIPTHTASQTPFVKSTPVISPSPATAGPERDTFGEAVNKAMSAATHTQSAKSKDDWNLVASQWQEAIALMKAVPSSHSQYTVAQQKAAEYQHNLDYAQKNALNSQ